MENRRPGRRQGSSRPSSRFNPITGEEYPDGNVMSNRNNSNNGNHQVIERVPALNLGNLEDKQRYVPTSMNQQEKVQRPLSPASTISWGTPASTARGLLATDRAYDEDADNELSSLRTPRVPIDEQLLDDDGQLDSQWVSDPYSYHQQEKITDAESLEDKKRREKIEETVMLDQLSRAVISDPSQDSSRSGAYDHLYHQPGQARGAIRRLHQSKVRTSATPTEQLLSQRVRFTARILTRVGADAIKDLTGFFFCAENSLTVYEYKQLGKTAKALPLINRGVYTHMVGRRRGLPYTLADIVSGNTLHFPTAGQKAIPDSARSMPVMAIRICEVDEKAKAAVVLADVRPSEQADVWNAFHALTAEEQRDRRLQSSIQSKIRDMIKRRGVKTFTGLSSQFRRNDRSGDGMLDKYELQAALHDFHINLSTEDFEQVWNVVDSNRDGVLDYGEFLRNFLGSMNEQRKQYVRKAFQKIDPMHSGVVSMAQMTKFFNAAKHPLVRSGQMSEIGLTEQFLGSWSHCQVRGEITYPEFDDYYEGLSVGIEDDLEFINILRNCWGL